MEGVLLLLSFFEKDSDRDHFFELSFLSEVSVDSGEAGVSVVAGVSLSATSGCDSAGVASASAATFSSLAASSPSYNKTRGN